MRCGHAANQGGAGTHPVVCAIVSLESSALLHRCINRSTSQADHFAVLLLQTGRGVAGKPLDRSQRVCEHLAALGEGYPLLPMPAQCHAPTWYSAPFCSQPSRLDCLIDLRSCKRERTSGLSATCAPPAYAVGPICNFAGTWSKVLTRKLF